MLTHSAILGGLNSLAIWALLAGLLSLTGCGSGLVSVSGEVKLNGAPLPNATVQFHPVDAAGALDPKRSVAVAQTDAAGKFILQTPNQVGSGALPGSYKVTVVAATQNLNDAQKAFPGASVAVPIKLLVALEYAEMAKTPLTVTIPAPGPIVLEVKGPTK